MFRIAAILFLALQALHASGPAMAQSNASPGAVVTVYKSKSCGCCGAWVEHLRKNGFRVIAHDVADVTSYREKLGIPQALGSCHSATVAGYAIEGHVPAADIRRLLRERPRARGIAVPAMPLGSPGMEGPRKDPYQTLLFHSDGDHVVFERH
jgi:hypothetical protein